MKDSTYACVISIFFLIYIPKCCAKMDFKFCIPIYNKSIIIRFTIKFVVNQNNLFILKTLKNFVTLE